MTRVEARTKAVSVVRDAHAACPLLEAFIQCEDTEMKQKQELRATRFPSDSPWIRRTSWWCVKSRDILVTLYKHAQHDEIWRAHFLQQSLSDHTWRWHSWLQNQFQMLMRKNPDETDVWRYFRRSSLTCYFSFSDRYKHRKNIVPTLDTPHPQMHLTQYTTHHPRRNAAHIPDDNMIDRNQTKRLRSTESPTPIEWYQMIHSKNWNCIGYQKTSHKLKKSHPCTLFSLSSFLSLLEDPKQKLQKKKLKKKSLKAKQKDVHKGKDQR